MNQRHNAATDSLFLAGEIHALVTFAQVLATISPNPRRLFSDFEAAEQVGLATTEMQLAGEELVDGYQFAIGQIRKALERAVAIAPNPDKR